MGAIASYIVDVCPSVTLGLFSGVFGSVKGSALEEGQAGEFMTSFKSTGTLDNG